MGRAGRLAALSFNGNKIVTTGGGGAVITDDANLGRAARHLATTAKMPHRWAFDHDQVAYNYRMPNINAALGCAQLAKLDALVAAKRALAAAYIGAFADVEGIAVLREPAGTRSNYWLNALVLDAADAAMRDAILARTNDAGFGTRPLWTPMHHLPMYAACPRMNLDTTEDMLARVINLPSSAHLTVRR